jgi:hypothetical protein
LVSSARFTSFDDAWSSFLARDEPLESFWSALPDDATFTVDRWLVIPTPGVKRAALRVQGALEDVVGLQIVAHDYLHVTLGALLPDALGDEPFEVRFPRLNCFPSAVVAEVESDVLDEVDVPTFLPHLSLAYVERAIDPRPLHDVLVPMRHADLGSFTVEELVHVRIPAAKTTFLQPWAGIDRVSLRR